MMKQKLIKKVVNTFYHYKQISNFNYIIDSYYINISRNTSCSCCYFKRYGYCEHIFYIYLFKFKFKIIDHHYFKTKFSKEEFIKLFKIKKQIERCSICLDIIKDNFYQSCHQCRNNFHQICFDHWIAQMIKDDKEPNCPLCRTNIFI